jgi:hypothetical protein
MAKKDVKKAAKSNVKKRTSKGGKIIHWIHVEEEIIIAGGGLAVIVMIFMFLF